MSGDQPPYPQYPSYPGSEGSAQPSWPPPHPGQMPGGLDGLPEYAGWWSRVGAYLLDALFVFACGGIPMVVGLVLAFANAETNAAGEVTGGVNPLGVLIMVLGFFAIIAADIWNRVYRLGTTGQSLGKKVAGIQVVKADHGTVIGGGAALGRWAITIVFGFVPLALLTLLDLLWPLWDDRNQTLHDKVVGSVVVPA